MRTEAGDLVGVSQGFESQGDAESWIGLEYGNLLEDGVDSVVLLHQGNEVYAMDLGE